MPFFRVILPQAKDLRLCLLVVLLLIPGVAAASAKPRVVATISPLADIVRQIAGDSIEVITLLPSGASPHTFEPRPAQMRDVAAATLVVRVGAGLDDWALRLLAAAATPPEVVAITDGIELLHEEDTEGHDHHGGDPHVWLDPVLVRDHIVAIVVSALKRLAPERANGFDQAAAQLRDKLSLLDAEVSATLAALENRKFIAFHSAWRYFAQRYRLQQVAVVEEFPGKEPSARAVAELIKLARRHHVQAMVVEPQFSARLAEQIASEFKGRAATADPMGGADITGRATYLDLMRFNAKAFAEALR